MMFLPQHHLIEKLALTKKPTPESRAPAVGTLVRSTKQPASSSMRAMHSVCTLTVGFSLSRMALTARGLRGLGRPRLYSGRSSTVTSIRWYAGGIARSFAAAASASARQQYSCCSAVRAVV